MTKAQENLKADIEKIDDEVIIEKIKIFIMGILAQQGIEQSHNLSVQLNKGADAGRNRTGLHELI